MNLLLLIYPLIVGAYICNHEVKISSSKSVFYMKNFMGSVYFFNKYLEKVGNEDLVYTPSVKGRYLLNNPQTIEYTSLPNITLLPGFFKRFGKIKVKQIWKIKNGIFIGEITSGLITFTIELSFKYKNRSMFLILKGEIKNKKFFIPNVALKYALYDFGNIFLEIIENR